MKKALFNAGIVSLILVTSIIFSGCSNTTSELSRAEDNHSSFIEGNLTEDSVRKALKGKSDFGYKIKLDNILDVSIKSASELHGVQDPNAKVVNITYTYEVWDDKDAVETAAASSLEIYQILFAHPDTYQVTTFAEQNFIDTYGKSSMETTVSIRMKREVADKIEWEGMKNNVLMDKSSLFKVVDYYKIHPGLDY